LEKALPRISKVFQVGIEVKDAIRILLALPAIYTGQLNPVEARCDRSRFGIDTGKLAYRLKLSQDDFVSSPSVVGDLRIRVIIGWKLERISLDVQ
jgi:hypothetical protein